MYFTNADYMIFTEENSANKSTAMIKERKKLQNKMLKLHEMIYSDVVKLGLSCHENKHHITTKIEPNRFNGKINSWLLVRYGKTPEEIALYVEPATSRLMMLLSTPFRVSVTVLLPVFVETVMMSPR